MRFSSTHRVILALLIGAALAGCAPFQPRTTLGVAVIPSPNFDQRKPNLVILHHTSNDTLERPLAALTSAERKVSAHYLISRDGRIIQLVDENARAWHAGKSWWGGNTDINSTSLGIELDNNGREPFPDIQIDTLLTLLADIRSRYGIPSANFIAHADVAPARKSDPSVWFPWNRLAGDGYGLWCDEPLPPAPDGFDLNLGLTALGYDPATMDASRQAFRLHFVRGDGILTEEREKALAFCLLQKKATLPR
jgi:N-acetylmuramoyl-L-alanine amidase